MENYSTHYKIRKIGKITKKTKTANKRATRHGIARTHIHTLKNKLKAKEREGKGKKVACIV